MQYYAEGGWFHERHASSSSKHPALKSCPEDRHETVWGKASVVCCAREGAGLVVFHESRSSSETHTQQDCEVSLEEGMPWWGVFAKVSGRMSRPLLMAGEEEDVSAVQIWVSGVAVGSTILIAIVNLPPSPLLEQILEALEPLGVPSGPVLPGCRALAAAGVVGGSVPWTSAHASEDAAYASVPIVLSAAA